MKTKDLGLFHESLTLVSPKMSDYIDPSSGVSLLLYAVRHRPLTYHSVIFVKELINLGADVGTVNLKCHKNLLHYLLKNQDNSSELFYPKGKMRRRVASIPYETKKIILEIITILQNTESSVIEKIINMQDDNLNTPMHYACREGDQDIVLKLLSVKGIDLSIKNNYGNTALNECRRNLVRKLIIKACEENGLIRASKYESDALTSETISEIKMCSSMDSLSKFKESNYDCEMASLESEIDTMRKESIMTAESHSEELTILYSRISELEARIQNSEDKIEKLQIEKQSLRKERDLQNDLLMSTWNAYNNMAELAETYYARSISDESILIDVLPNVDDNIKHEIAIVFANSTIQHLDTIIGSNEDTESEKSNETYKFDPELIGLKRQRERVERYLMNIMERRQIDPEGLSQIPQHLFLLFSEHPKRDKVDVVLDWIKVSADGKMYIKLPKSTEHPICNVKLDLELLEIIIQNINIRLKTDSKLLQASQECQENLKIEMDFRERQSKQVIKSSQEQWIQHQVREIESLKKCIKMILGTKADDGLLGLLEKSVKAMDPAAIVESKEFVKCKQRPRFSGYTNLRSDVVQLLHQYSNEALSLLAVSIERTKRYGTVLNDLISENFSLLSAESKYSLDPAAQSQYDEIMKLNLQIARLRVSGDEKSLKLVEKVYQQKVKQWIDMMKDIPTVKQISYPKFKDSGPKLLKSISEKTRSRNERRKGFVLEAISEFFPSSFYGD